LCVENTLLNEDHQLLTEVGVFLRHRVEVETPLLLQFRYHGLHLLVLQDLLNLRVILNDLHDGVSFHFLFFLLLFLLSNILKMTRHKLGILLHHFSELWVAAVLFHRFSRVLSHFLENLIALGIRKRGK